MAFWTDRAPHSNNIRLFHRDDGWKKYDDNLDEDGRVVYPGAHYEIDLTLSTLLNASNLVLLTGAGSSFSASNGPGKKQAPSMSDLWDAVETRITPTKLARIKALIPKSRDIEKNVEKLLTLSKLYVSLFDDVSSEEVQSFIDEAESAILNCVDFVDRETELPSHQMILRKLARRGPRKPRAKIFTTNYDLCFEFAAQRQQFVVIDGFSHSNPQFYDRSHFSYDTVRRVGHDGAPDYIENVFQFYKLHGSVDWRRTASGIIRSRSAAGSSPVLIYPRDTKYQEAFEPPYLDMMGAFQTALREPDSALIISGFGFADDHVSKPIMAAVEANMSLRLVVCDPAFLTDDALKHEPNTVEATSPMRLENPYLEQLRTLAAAGDPRITLLSGRFQDLAQAIPDLVAQTERERHSERMRAVLLPGRLGSPG